MTCTRCRQFEAAPGGGLCRACEAEEGHPDVGPGLPPAPPLVAGVPLGPPALLRSPVALGRAVAILLGAVAVADLVAVWADLALLDVMDRLATADWSAALEHDSDRADRLIAFAGVLQTLTYVATIIVFVFWFHRVRVNAEVFDPFGHRKKRGWAIGGWFVPLANLWIPRRIAVDCWDASGPWRKPRSHALVNAWWTLWLLSLFAGEAGDRAYIRAQEVEEYRSAARQMLFADSLEIVSAVFAVLFVLALTRMQDDKARSGPREPAPDEVR
ncbi:DUF4328 domain-containing protein [Streptomyces brasiliscabiei]|uniref:DUF4328 domain-containing protein n=1 Tax=Streptomyces brasiliscabiei TaxID=2736302 RepID=UPI001C0F9037|nr:DUF4328 domain-containing protein [Streptomyces brasiliscabiei]